MHWCHGGGRALCGYSRNGFIFKPRWAEGFYTYRTLRIGYPDGFSAQAVVHRGDHPHWDEYIDVVDIPGNIGPFWFELSRNAANLSVYCLGVGLISVDGRSYLKAKVKFSEPIFFKQHEGQMG